MVPHGARPSWAHNRTLWAVWTQTRHPSLPQPVKSPGWKRHGHACKQYVFPSYNKSLSYCALWWKSVHVLMQKRKKKKKKEDAKFVRLSHFYRSFSSKIVAVKGLKRTPSETQGGLTTSEKCKYFHFRCPVNSYAMAELVCSEFNLFRAQNKQGLTQKIHQMLFLAGN